MFLFYSTLSQLYVLIRVIHHSHKIMQPKRDFCAWVQVLHGSKYLIPCTHTVLDRSTDSECESCTDCTGNQQS